MASDQPLYKVEVLSKNHDRQAFSCGVAPLDHYFQRQAGQELRKNIAVPFVMLERETGRIVGYYTLSSFSVPLETLPEKLSKKLPKYGVVPATLIGRLAISSEHRGRGLGGILLTNALRKCLEQSETIASLAVVVDAKDESAVSFYDHFGFISFHGQLDRLYLPIETIKRELGG